MHHRNLILFLAVSSIKWHTCVAWVNAVVALPIKSRADASDRGLPNRYPTELMAAAISYIEDILINHGYDTRIKKISTDQLPVLAEVYVNGHSTLARIMSFQVSASSEHDPKFSVELIDDGSQQIVDSGQVTTIWENKRVDDCSTLLASTVLEKEFKRIPAKFKEAALDRLYKNRVGRARSSSRNLSKKEVNKIIEDFDDENDRNHVGNVLRKVIKAGHGLSRLVDSSIAKDFVYKNKAEKSMEQDMKELAVAGQILSGDAEVGGRFKRWPCVFLSSVTKNDELQAISVVNGGWLVLDQSVRAGTEARKFAERSMNENENKNKIVTAADERIIRRLECLAMGELFYDNQHTQNEKDLELDVREALNALNIPLTPEGAKTALIRIGRWVGDENAARFQPWPRDILEAASWYAEVDKERQLDAVKSSEQRVDLTSLPCVSIDAKRTTFRDDAIGVRSREGTGRRFVPEASKWEILIHITDMSDIYNPESIPNDPNGYLSILREAAKSRGTSRYDLPLGPLHLLPPVALEALSFSDRKGFGRCVTLWVYIDERNGKLLDAGVERTVVSSPVRLSFQQATDVMDGKLEVSDAKKVRAILLVIERNLAIWSENRRKRSESAQKREERLAMRESKLEGLALGDTDDDGRVVFQRTRGHRIVDASLDMYAFAASGLLKKNDVPVPQAKGAGVSRGGRFATAPLRRYIDGISQRQLVAALCNYGKIMNSYECREASKVADDARNAIKNIRSVKKNN